MRLKNIVEEKTRRKEEKTTEKTEGNIDLTATKNERTLKGAYSSFVIPRELKTDIDGYFDQAKLHAKALVEDQLKQIQSVKVIFTCNMEKACIFSHWVRF